METSFPGRRDGGGDNDLPAGVLFGELEGGAREGGGDSDLPGSLGGGFEGGAREGGGELGRKAGSEPDFETWAFGLACCCILISDGLAIAFDVDVGVFFAGNWKAFGPSLGASGCTFEKSGGSGVWTVDLTGGACTVDFTGTEGACTVDLIAGEGWLAGGELDFKPYIAATLGLPAAGDVPGLTEFADFSTSVVDGVCTEAPIGCIMGRFGGIFTWPGCTWLVDILTGGVDAGGVCTVSVFGGENVDASLMWPILEGGGGFEKPPLRTDPTGDAPGDEEGGDVTGGDLSVDTAKFRFKNRNLFFWIYYFIMKNSDGK